MPVFSFAGRFEDVSDGKWYSEGISFCAANGYMDGIAEGVFDRSSDINRAMFMTILAKVDGVDLSQYGGKSDFIDVKADRWYTAAISWAAENGITGGIGEDDNGNPVFGYKNIITREQIALFLYVYSEHVNDKNTPPAEEESSPESSPEDSVEESPVVLLNDETNKEDVEPNIIDLSHRADLSVFEDGDRTRVWAREAMEWAVAVGLISGTGEKTLDPRGNCSRAQAAVIIRAYVLTLLSSCEHEWVDATCLEMGYCTKCELMQATELGHDFGKHLCTDAVKCSRCEVMTVPKAHTLSNATCTTASVCSVCGYVAAPATGHDFPNGTPNCTAAKTCRKCYYTEAAALGHDMVYATCTTSGYCKRCSYTTSPLGHTTRHGYCSNCGIGIFETIFHYVNYNADMVAVMKEAPCSIGIYMPSAAMTLSSGSSWGWIAKYSSSNQYTTYLSYGSNINGEIIEVGFEVTPGGVEADGSVNYSFYAYRRGGNNKKICAAKGYVEANTFTSSSRVVFDQYYNFWGDQYKSEFEGIVSDYLKKALRFANGRFNAKGMGITVKDLGFVNFN